MRFEKAFSVAVLLVAALAAAEPTTKPASSTAPAPPESPRTGEARPRLLEKPGCDKDPGIKRAGERLPEDTAVVLDVSATAEGKVEQVAVVSVSPESDEGTAMAEMLRACWMKAKFAPWPKPFHIRPRLMLRKEIRAGGVAPAGSASPKP